MKFDCGLSADDKLVKEFQELQKLIEIRSFWHPWFAWRPIIIASHDCRWLETVERRGTHIGFMYGRWIWEYRAIKTPNYLGAK